MLIREALIADIPRLKVIRHSVRENVLSNPGQITEWDYVNYLTIRGKGWVCASDNQIVGFAIADLKEHNVWALFIMPVFEGKGIGKRLHDIMLNWYFQQTRQTIWLSTAYHTRAEVFYRKQGWKEAGAHGPKEIRFEMSFDDWEVRSYNIN